MKKLLLGSLAMVVFLATGCASTSLSKLQSAQSNLDSGNYTAAIEDAQDALAADPGNVEATRVLASAYFGRSGLDFLDLAAGITDLSNSSDTNFTQIANLLPDECDLDDLRLAIESLEALADVDDENLGTTDEDLADAVFDLAFMQAIEHFAIGVYQSGFKSGTMDVTDITGSDDVLDDLIDFDTRMVNSGVDASESFISDVRQTFCILEPLSAGDGFTSSEYQALVGCQLEPDTFDPSLVDASIANCTALDPDSQSAEIQNCYDEDTTL